MFILHLLLLKILQVKCVRKMDPKAYLLWILVFDDQYNQIGLMNLQVIIL